SSMCSSTSPRSLASSRLVPNMALRLLMLAPVMAFLVAKCFRATSRSTAVTGAAAGCGLCWTASGPVRPAIRAARTAFRLPVLHLSSARSAVSCASCRSSHLMTTPVIGWPNGSCPQRDLLGLEAVFIAGRSVADLAQRQAGLRHLAAGRALAQQRQHHVGAALLGARAA